jgi:hypothetical protein
MHVLQVFKEIGYFKKISQNDGPLNIIDMKLRKCLGLSSIYRNSTLSNFSNLAEKVTMLATIVVRMAVLITLMVSHQYSLLSVTMSGCHFGILPMASKQCFLFSFAIILGLI